ncbi:MAG: hypothetical protein KDJ35_08905 [Alphaproteobacteria bacterium]|nr:hypothetical protein [Alphaproteobacteria bacterium]
MSGVTAEGISSKNEQEQGVVEDTRQASAPDVASQKPRPVDLKNTFNDKAGPSPHSAEVTAQVENKVREAPKLYGTEKTLESLGPEIRENLVQWTGAKKGVLFVSGEDLPDVAPPDPDSDPDIEFDINQKNRADAMENFLKDYPSAAKEMDSNDPDYQAYMAGYYNSVKQDFFSVRKSGDSDNSNQRDFVVISSHKRPDQISAAEWSENLSGLPKSELANVSGTSKEYMLFAIGHELGHANEGTEKEVTSRASPTNEDKAKILEEETNVDLSADRFYKERLADGSAATVDVPEDILDMRAISTLRSAAKTGVNYNAPTFSAHATNGGISLDNKNLIKNDFNASSVGAGSVNVNSLSSVLAGKRMEGLLEAQGVSIEDVPSMNLDPKDSVNNAMMVGSNELKGDPLLQYATVKTLLDKGYFPEGTAEHEVASDFVKAFGEHVPGVNSDKVKQYLEDMQDIDPASETLLQKMAGLDQKEVLSAGTNSEEYSVLKLAGEGMKL